MLLEIYTIYIYARISARTVQTQIFASPSDLVTRCETQDQTLVRDLDCNRPVSIFINFKA